MIRYGFFSQSKFESNMNQLNRFIRSAIVTNKQFPYVGTLLYGNYYVMDTGEVSLLTHISFEKDHTDKEHNDLIYMGKIAGFSHYPEEIMKKEEYSDPITIRCLYGPEFINSIR